MTRQEAIKYFENEKNNPMINHRKVDEILNMAIADMEKQIPKKPILVKDSEYSSQRIYCCTSCEGNFAGTGIAKYCYHCGQHLKWSEEDD